MKITTQILSTYLPHKLQFEGGGDIWTLYSVGAEGDIVLKNGLHTQVVNSSVVGVEYLPFLRPLSTFYQHSIFGGEMFCPKDRVTDQLSAINSRNNIEDFYLMCDNAEILQATKIFNYMASLHFDLFALIDNGLAVTIS